MKPEVIIYKIFAYIVLLIFVYFIGDVNRTDSKPLVKKHWLFLMSIFFPIPPICYAYFLYKLKWLTFIDVAALLLMIFGVLIIGLSRRKLGSRHSWTGFSKQNITTFEKNGIYKIIRHPLYTGIYIAVLGSMFVVIQRAKATDILLWAYLLANIFVFAFIYVSSLRESKALRERFGDEYLHYEKQVPAFIPRLIPQKKDSVDRASQ